MKSQSTEQKNENDKEDLNKILFCFNFLFFLLCNFNVIKKNQDG